ncbi:MAG: hypothetical protein LBG65_06850 [Puniceicoccales bacterium]|jgi:hypothetical protein|nr:hypothetical protein [Puniceicoccales bacterium]
MALMFWLPLPLTWTFPLTPARMLALAAAALGGFLSHSALALALALKRGGFGETAPPRNYRWRCCWRQR